MIKSFSQWKVVKDGIEAGQGCNYWWISKDDIMRKNMVPVNDLSQNPLIHQQSLLNAYHYAYRYFHAMTQYSKSHPDIYKRMESEYARLEWVTSLKGNYTLQVSNGFFITIYPHPNDGRWAWVFDGLFSTCTYKSADLAKKKAYTAYYWLHKHILVGA